MRIYSYVAVAAIIALGACTEPAAPSPRELAAQDDAVDLIECALGDGSHFGADCSAERVDAPSAELIVRHPGGGFRRFELAGDASGLVAADGADVAVNRLDGDMLEVRVAQDRYRFPARLTGEGDKGGDGD